MTELLDSIRGMAFRPAGEQVLAIAGPESTPYVAFDPRRLEVAVAPGAVAALVVVHTEAEASSLKIVLGEGARLDMTEVFAAEAFAEVAVEQAARSECRTTTVELTSANAAYTVDLNGCEARSTVHGVFLAAACEHCVVELRTNHNVPDCNSASLVKGVAGGEALGEFRGLVYVAQDAQHTDARQTSRNILLSETARIVTKPQLEIYADDVKCSHGATVGQMDADAVLYMRQRGLSEAQARRLQIEGFVGDVVLHCGIDPLCQELMRAVQAKMERM